MFVKRKRKIMPAGEIGGVLLARAGHTAIAICFVPSYRERHTKKNNLNSD